MALLFLNAVRPSAALGLSPIQKQQVASFRKEVIPLLSVFQFSGLT
ncbi:hypothetical protein [Xanthocytophaga agilis]|uniref:Uncharacterized protein n=1 Tax=Xanthocytophaga agilis TaxID=3048010 RepID=A0AAE3RDA6_9BACT|nr:hypothetical protein [Xanthocytophaga agilis]MDJ1505822.1 hypothetical protein [Xanthocytophaga agilis]